MLYNNCVFLLLLSLFVGSFCVDNSPNVAMVLGRNLGIDECEFAHLDYLDGNILTISASSINLGGNSDVVSSCIRGNMDVGDYFYVKFYNNDEELSELGYREDFEGTEPKLPTLEHSFSIRDISSLLDFSGSTLSRVIDVKLFYKEEIDEISSFELNVAAPSQSIGESSQPIVFVNSEPTRFRDCLSDSDDILDTIASGNTFYVCGVFYNLICPDTQFNIDVDGIESNGLTAQLGDLNDNYSCDENDDSFVVRTFRYVEISSYNSLDSVNVVASMQSNDGETESVDRELVIVSALLL